MSTTCPAYEEAILKLQNDLDGTPSLSEKRNLFNVFHRKHTMIPSLWIKWLKIEWNASSHEYYAIRKKQQDEIKQMAKTHFFHQEFDERDACMNGEIEENLFFTVPPFENDDSLFFQLNYKGTNPGAAAFEKLLHFPHYGLDEMFKIYNRYAAEPMSKASIEKYQQSKKLFTAIWGNNKEKVAENWFEEIVKMKDNNFIRNSFEYFLGQHYFDKTVWKAYITFLEPVNSELLLNVYSRYCRLFIDDLEMRKKYLKEIEKMNKTSKDVSLWWIDLVEIERQFVSFNSAEHLLENVMMKNDYAESEVFQKYIQWFKQNEDMTHFDYFLPCVTLAESKQNEFYIEPQKACKNYFTPTNEFRQLFSLPYHYMQYIQSTQNYAVLQKLYLCCKFFFNKFKTPICHRLGIFFFSKSTYYKQSLFLNRCELGYNRFFEGLNELTVTHMLQVSCKKPSIASKVLSKIKYQIKHLVLHWQYLSEKEFDLISGDKIETVLLQYIKVKNSDGNKLSISEIINKFPKANTIRLISGRFQDDTAENLSMLNRSKNLKLFYLEYVPETFNENFFLFVKKFALPYSRIFIKFESTVDKNYINEFETKGKTILQEHRDIFVVVH